MSTTNVPAAHCVLFIIMLLVNSEKPGRVTAARCGSLTAPFWPKCSFIAFVISVNIPMVCFVLFYMYFGSMLLGRTRGK